MKRRTDRLGFGCLLPAVPLCLALCGCADRSRNVEAEREGLRGQAKTLAEQRAEAQVRPEAIAAECGYEYPVPSPTATFDEVRRNVEAETARRVAEKFPDTAPEAFRAEIEARYPVKKTGDTVDFLLRGGLGLRTKAQGRVTQSTAERVMIGDHWVLKADLADADRSSVDPEFRAALVEKEYRAKLFLWKDDRERLAESLKRELGEAALRAAGYVQQPNGRWRARAEIFEERRRDAIRRLARQMAPAVEEELFTDAGYVLREGEWQPSAAARTFKAVGRARTGER